MKILAILLLLIKLSLSYCQTNIEEAPVTYSFNFDSSKINTYTLPEQYMPLDFASKSMEDSKKYNIKVDYIGIGVDVNFDVKKFANSKPYKNGRVWLLKITSPNACGLGVYIKKPNLINGAKIYLYNIEKTEFEMRDESDTADISPTIDGNLIYLEYFEPDTNSNKPLIVNRIIYNFKKINFWENKEKKSKLKSGGPYGDDILNCQKNVVCDVGVGRDISNVMRSTALLYCKSYSAIKNVYDIVKGTGCFINKESNYEATDHPFFLTCSHVLNPLYADFIDLDASLKNDCKIVINYESPTCGNEDASGISLNVVKKLKIISWGGGTGEPTDYMLLQFIDETAESLKIHNNSYAGFDRSGDYSKTPHIMLHHPNGDIKKITIDKYERTGTPEWVTFTWTDGGAVEPGSSGAPIFNSENKIVAIELMGTVDCDKLTTADCLPIGTIFTDNPTIQLALTPNNLNTIDEFDYNHVYSPNHCQDCIKDGDETGIDRGGSCQSCEELAWNKTYNFAINSLPALTTARNLITHISCGNHFPFSGLGSFCPNISTLSNNCIINPCG